LAQTDSSYPLNQQGALRSYMSARGLPHLTGETQLMILPGYRFALCDALITNFHQPRSTLMLLVGAVLGGLDRVQAAYSHALSDEAYRFLSFGDACLFVSSGSCRLDTRLRPRPLELQWREKESPC
jgi:S-adenosylmethionine:tRNA-ribosyltransferase-isomerase (queuine synthetase)